MRILFISCLLFITGLSLLKAQNGAYLSLEKPSRFKRERIFPGDTLVLRVENDKVWHGGILQRVHENSIILSGDSISIDSITGIMRARNGTIRHWVNNARFVAFAAEVPLPILITANRIVYNMGPVITVKTLIIAASGFVVRAILKPLSARKYKIGRRWELQQLELLPE